MKILQRRDWVQNCPKWRYLIYEQPLKMNFDYFKVLQAPESSPKPRARPKPSRPRNSTLSTTSANQRYGVSESTIEAYKSASAGRRSSSVYGDAKALEKFRQTISTGFQTATETGEWRCQWSWFFVCLHANVPVLNLIGVIHKFGNLGVSIAHWLTLWLTLGSWWFPIKLTASIK